MIGQRIFVGWPFLQEGMVSAVSDSLFKYEKIVVVPGNPPKVVSNPHAQQGLSLWKSKAEKIEYFYSKRCGVITGDIDVLVHVRPLKGLKRLESGAFVKDYEGPDKETEQAAQMAVSEVASEDARFMEKEAPPLSEEFPNGSKVFFLGEHAYGVAAQVFETTKDTLSIVLAFFPSEKADNDRFKDIVNKRTSQQYFPSFKVANMVGLSGLSVARITSNFMVIMTDGQKHNLGLGLKFEAKGLKVIDYSRKDGRHWEFSEKAVDLLHEYKGRWPEVMAVLRRPGDAMVTSADVFPNADNPDANVREVQAWLKSKSVRNFEPVSLFCDQLKKETVKEIEAFADSCTTKQSRDAIKKAIVKGIPRQAVLKPAHAVYRLQNQHFALGDRVTMVQDSGGVPLSVKGVIIGMNAKSMDVVWDVPFMSGTTLGDRCSQYRGSTVEFTSCLNLTNSQFIASTNPKAPAQQKPTSPFNPRFGPHPVVQPAPGQQAASGYRPGPQVSIMANPNRGRAAHTNGRGNHWNGRANGDHQQVAPLAANDSASRNGHAPTSPRAAKHHDTHRGRGGAVPHIMTRDGAPAAQRNGAPAPPRGGFMGRRGRGSFHADDVDRDRGRGGRGFRGRGRGHHASPVDA
ncbi:uncharacterized protein PHACADRAFT_117592 [Phanerochaete carnosa HHB-10118-sp]|uniref:Uncharacterized protein n=1 Tax=Phanerochaete carnosa (strain HHB-10118-sp) TaxID=650164 RepID=K5V723_PHACS|nr:uncharacterized protein PHACADRAFT_117592 [Phanerochaete carnosa HHB-10118-sp]EKM58546.1 hypothetical protein PHACADRAFT_117592 [Phanerochaete carnosa HHB-10118-sp]